MSQSKLMEMEYFDLKSETRLETYTDTIVIEREKYETTWIQAFYAIPRSKGALLVEVSRYTGMPEKAENCLEEMLASFSLKTEE